MQGTAYVRSPAKLNLHLEVQSKREDGFHSIISIFQLIDLYDDISIRSLKEKNVCRISGMPDVPLEENLVYRALQVFRIQTGIQEGFQIDLVKRIPQEAGLGGGSSNAAFTLKLLNLICGTGLSDTELAEIGAELGSDVPFFCVAPCAAVTGRGEIVKPMIPRRDLWGLLLVPELAISTKDAYAEFDLHIPSTSTLVLEEAVEAYRNKDPKKWPFFNSLELVISKRFPELARTIHALRNAGASFFAMSGSGSSCFGIFPSEKMAFQAKKGMARNYKLCLVVHLLDKRPNPILQ